MSLRDSIEKTRGNLPVNGRQPARPQRRFEIFAKDFTSVEQAVPLRVVYGQARISAEQITPIFGFRNEPIRAKGKAGSKGGGAGSGYNYFGSFAVALCHGPIYRLHAITNGDTEVWAGPSLISSADGNGRTSLTTTLGTIDFYWGTDTQEVDDTLAAMTIDLGSGPVTVPMPAFRNVCYAVARDLAFGQQVVPPTLVFHVERILDTLDLTAHDIDGDAVLPEVIYELLTNTFYGCGLDEDDIDLDSFVDAAETTIGEGLGASPDIDGTDKAREFIGRMLSYIDGFLFVDGGKLKIGLTRAEDVSLVPHADEADLLNEPQPTQTQFEGTWNRTIVTFRDRENEWEETSEDYDDPANAVIVGQSIDKTFNFPWITSRAVAKQLAKLIGIRGGLPVGVWQLTLKPKWHTLLPGSLFKLSYDKFGITNRVMRVKSVTIGKPSEPDVTVTVQEEQTRFTNNDYVAPDDNFEVPGTLDGNGSSGFTLSDTPPRLSWLPDELKADETDGLLVACERPDTFTIGGVVYWTWDPGVQSYRALQNLGGFPAKGVMVSWHSIRTSNWLLRVELEAVDYEWLQSLQEQITEFYAVVGRRDVKTTGTPNDEHQIMAPWLKPVAGGRFELITDRIIDIEVEGGAFGTDDLLLETAGADGRFPTVHVYFGRLEDFCIFPTSTVAFEQNAGNAIGDTDKKRYIKVTLSNHVNQQELSDVAAVTYDRDDTTMCPDGTLSEDWGDYAVTTYELLDTQLAPTAFGGSAPLYEQVEDLDTALGAIALGSGSPDQILNLSHVNDVLGAMIDDGHEYYNV